MWTRGRMSTPPSSAQCAGEQHAAAHSTAQSQRSTQHTIASPFACGSTAVVNPCRSELIAGRAGRFPARVIASISISSISCPGDASRRPAALLTCYTATSGNRTCGARCCFSQRGDMAAHGGEPCGAAAVDDLQVSVADLFRSDAARNRAVNSCLTKPLVCFSTS